MPARCSSAPPIRRSVWSGGSPPASRTAVRRAGLSTRSPPWSVNGCSVLPWVTKTWWTTTSCAMTRAMAILAGKLEARRSDCAPLAGKSTLNRLEHAPAAGPTRYHKIGHDAAAIERLFVDLFLDAHRKPPAQITLDLDATEIRSTAARRA